VSARCSVHLHSANANLFITAHCSAHLSHCSCAHLLRASACLFVKNKCCCTTSRSLLPDACSGILHNSRWLLFHPRAVTPLGSSLRTRVPVSVHFACSHLCICAQGDQIHHTHEASRKSVINTCHLLREANSVVAFDLIMTMITTAKSPRLLLHCCVQPLLMALFGHLWPQNFALGSLFTDRCFCFCSSRRYLRLPRPRPHATARAY
jgi:hypothetical protein